MNSKQREEELTLQVLEAIEARSDVTQRHLAGQMGVALGLANSYLKRCVHKGLVKIQQAPANRYLYYLTPRGFAEKSRLTAEYLSYSFSFYRTASRACQASLAEFRAAGHTRLGLFGVSELAEIAVVQAMQLGIRPLCAVSSRRKERFLGMPVAPSVERAPAVDAWLLTALEDPTAAHARLCASVGAGRVFVPSVLGIEASAARDVEDGSGEPGESTGSGDGPSSTSKGIQHVE